MANQNPEKLKDTIDHLLAQVGWKVQSKNSINLVTATGVAIREYATNIGPSDYVLFVDKKPIGIIEAKRAEEGVHLTVQQAGLTAKPDKRTFGYFNENGGSDYGYEKAVVDGVLVPYNVFTMEIKIAKEGSAIAMGKQIDRRE